jgi:transcriptional regulator with XRE-family HTH domain
MNASVKSDEARGERLKELRKRAGLTQQQVANQLSVDKSSVSRWEQGDVFPREYLRQLCELYTTEPEYITFGVKNADDFEVYAAFDSFLEWLRNSPYERITEPWHVEALRSMRMNLPPGVEPTVEVYQRFVEGVLAMRKAEKPEKPDKRK